MSLQEELSAAAAQNFGAILDRQADAHPDHVAFLTPVGGSDEPNEWVPLTFAQFRRQAHDVAAGLLTFDSIIREIAGGRWIVGDAPTIADVACFPYVALAGDGGLGHEEYPALRNWMRDFRRLPRFHAMSGIPEMV